MGTGTSGVGVLFRATDETDLIGLARAAEERGFDAFVVGEHTHIPVNSDHAEFPGGDHIPQSYARLLDPYIALAFIAASTSLKIGTCTSLPAEHDPIALAKAVATLDHLSGGRLTFGVGYGWNSQELVNHGQEFKRRRVLVREYVELMRALWSDTVASYRGSLVTLEPSWSWPKPAQPSIPVLLGVAGGAKGMDDMVQWGDGWMPGGPPTWIADRLSVLRRRWADAGRPETGPVVWAIQELAEGDQARRNLDVLREAGVQEILLSFDTTDEQEVLPVLDRYAGLLTPSVVSG